MTTPRPLASIDEVAAYLGKTDKTLRNWIKRGYGPRSFRVGMEIRYRWDEVESWVDQQEQRAEEAPEEPCGCMPGRPAA